MLRVAAEVDASPERRDALNPGWMVFFGGERHCPRRRRILEGSLHGFIEMLVPHPLECRTGRNTATGEGASGERVRTQFSRPNGSIRQCVDVMAIFVHAGL
jgi:hypothetical protein